MRKAHIVFLIIGLLYFIQIPLLREYSTSVVPGWHATIYPPYVIDVMLVGLWIFILTVAYWILTKRNKNVNKRLFVAHLLLTLPFILFYVMRNEVLAYSIISGDYSLLDFFFYVSAPLFVIGQIIFMIYFIQSIRSRISKM